MSLSNPRSINWLLTIDERNDVHWSIAKAKAEQNDVRQLLAKAEAEIRTLLVHQEKVTNNILQLKKTLVIHRILPREIIGYIFSILRAEKVSIPHSRHMTPSQITVSHVCSKWREIALATPALWSDVEIRRPGRNEWVQIAIELVFNRVGMRGVNLMLNLSGIGSDKMEKAFYDIVLSLHVKKLHLSLPSPALENLSQKSDDIIANIDEIALSFTFNPLLVSHFNQVSIAPPFLSKIRSVTILAWVSQHTLVQHFDLQQLPWAQLRHLSCGVALTLSTIHDILRQSPSLDVCGISVQQDNEAEPTTVLTLSQLRIFHIIVYGMNGPKRDQDKILQSFKCPNLTDFRLDIPHWTAKTYKIIENHYNFHRLLRFEISRYPYPISKLLFDAPMLQELILYTKVFMDERALQGIASGVLGRCLTSLVLEGNFNEKRVLAMVASRQRHVKQVVEASRSWQDQISGIKWIALLNDDVEPLVELEDELKDLGVIVYYSTDPWHSHPLFSLA